MLITGSLVAATVVGYAARRLRIPGGAIVGALVVTAVISLTVAEVTVPGPMRLVVFVAIGTLLGSRVDRASLRALPGVAVQAVLAGVLLIAAGIGIAYLLRVMALAPHGDMLATSPGALSVLAIAALENDLDAPTVAVFHIMRIVLILLSLPLLVYLLPGFGSAADAARLARRTATESAVVGAGPDGGARPDRTIPDRDPRSSRMEAADIGLLALTALAALGGGLLAAHLGIRGPMIVGTVTGAAVVTVSSRRDVHRPAWLPFVLNIGLGWLIGAMVTRETVDGLAGAALGATISSVLIIATGIGIALLLRILGVAPEGDVLATSPGAVEALAIIADEHDAGPMQVTVFHTVRLVLVIASLPLLLQLTP